MSDLKARPIPAPLLAKLAKYEPRFRKALNNERVELSSVARIELAEAHYRVFGVREAMASCCGNSRTTAQRLAPLARAYFTQINGAPEDTTSLLSVTKPIKAVATAVNGMSRTMQIMANAAIDAKKVAETLGVDDKVEKKRKKAKEKPVEAEKVVEVAETKQEIKTEQERPEIKE